jgi:hypothetical protein
MNGGGGGLRATKDKMLLFWSYGFGFENFETTPTVTFSMTTCHKFTKKIDFFQKSKAAQGAKLSTFDGRSSY